MNNPKQSISTNILPPGMVKAWRKLSKKEQERYIRENLKYLSSVIQKEEGGKSYQLVSKPKNITSRCEKDSFLCLSKP